ncbi:MAG: AmmeMemoRadiSam system protein B [Promethearchaeota archaeon]
MGIKRRAASAGQFYPRFKRDLLQTINDCYLDSNFGPGAELKIASKDPTQESNKRKVLGVISPHAGYVYSGSAAAFSFQELFREGLPDTLIILGTQHTGYHEVATMASGVWETPLGDISVDVDLSLALVDGKSPIIVDDSAFNGFPHGREHNIEVQLPFVKHAALCAKKEIKIVPIKIGAMDSDTLDRIGSRIADVIQQNASKDIAIIASSDMTHFGPRTPFEPFQEIQENQTLRDQKVIDAFEKMDWQETYKYAKQTTVCGPQTISTLMITALNLGYKNGKKLKYYNSFQKTGEQTPCEYSVGYFSGAISL